MTSLSFDISPNLFFVRYGFSKFSNFSNGLTKMGSLYNIQKHERNIDEILICMHVIVINIIDGAKNSTMFCPHFYHLA